MCMQWERIIITYVIANFGRENLSPSSEEQMKRKQYVWKKALWPKIMNPSNHWTQPQGWAPYNHKAIKDVHWEGASYKLKHLSKDLNLSKMGSTYNNEKLSIAT
jgi:hypothetical protein